MWKAIFQAGESVFYPRDNGELLEGLEQKGVMGAKETLETILSLLHFTDQPLHFEVEDTEAQRG